MNQRRLGDSSLLLSEVGLGCNNFGWRVDLAGAQAVVGRALDLGVTLFDTADMYGNRGASEEMLGKALGARRKDVVVATKFGMAMGDGPEWRGASARYVKSAAEASLKRLGTDWIDLYQLHVADPETPVEETMRALDDLVRGGKVRHVGVCNLNVDQLAAFQAAARSAGLSPVISLQVEYSLLAREAERDLIPALDGVGLLPFFPLAGGLLTGKYREPDTAKGRLSDGSALSGKFLTDDNRHRVERLGQLAERSGGSLLQLAFAWLLAKPSVSSVIAGATGAEQVTQNVLAAQWRASEATLRQADEISSTS